jgi:hypothetical protein
MQQRQPRLGDTLDDYCTRERRLTNHAVVAMVGAEIKQTRCTTCDTEHEYKHAKVPRQRRKLDSPAALYAQVAAGAPKRVTGTQGTQGTAEAKARAGEHDDDMDIDETISEDTTLEADDDTSDSDVLTVPTTGGGSIAAGAPEPGAADADNANEDDANEDDDRKDDEGPVHRPLIRASLPREGQPPTVRPIPEFTIRQPTGRPGGRFRPRHQGGAPFQGGRSNSNGSGGPGGPGGPRSAGPRHGGGGGGRPPQGAMASRRHGSGRKRQK